MQQPSIGRIVHYKNGKDIWAAMIVKVEQYQDKQLLSLQVFMTEEAHDQGVVEYPQVYTDEVTEGPHQAKDGLWWWPERV